MCTVNPHKMQVFKSTAHNIIVVGDIFFHDKPAFRHKTWVLTTTIHWLSPTNLITVSGDMGRFIDWRHQIRYRSSVKVEGKSRSYLSECVGMCSGSTTYTTKKYSTSPVDRMMIQRILNSIYWHIYHRSSAMALWIVFNTTPRRWNHLDLLSSVYVDINACRRCAHDVSRIQLNRQPNGLTTSVSGSTTVLRGACLKKDCVHENEMNISFVGAEYCNTQSDVKM